MSVRPTAMELFSGVGGMTLAFQQAGFEVLAAFDIEQFNVTTHEKNFTDCRAFVADLSTQSGDSLRQLASIGPQEIDVVFGGPPCQGFSYGGHMETSDDRNLLVLHFARLVRELEPKYFVMENVQGLLAPHAQPILKSFITRIKRAGYHLTEPIVVLNAADYGVPQRRRRTFILGCKKGLPEITYPEPKGLYLDGQSFFPIVRDAIADLPNIDAKNCPLIDGTFHGELREPRNVYAKLLRGLLIDAQDELRPMHEYKPLTGCLRTEHSPQTIARFAATIPGQAEPVSRYIRLHWDDVSPTLRAGTGKDRGSHTAPRPIHPSKPRCISTREAARLHSFPDWFQFHGTRWHDFRQIGNSVPPILGKAVADAAMIAIKASRYPRTSK